MDVLKCYIMKEKYVCLCFQPMCVINEWFKSIEQILNVMFKYKQKRNVRLLKHCRMTYFYLEYQKPIKKSNIVIFFGIHISYISFQTFGM
jgi:hypothetical protein